MEPSDAFDTSAIKKGRPIGRPVPVGRWRRRRDSNPRYLAVRRFSRPVHSTTLPLLREWVLQYIKKAADESAAIAAEEEGFEPPVPVKVHLISNQARSASSATPPD